MPQDESELRAYYERSLTALEAQTGGGPLFIQSVAQSLALAQLALREANNALMGIGKAARTERLREARYDLLRIQRAAAGECVECGGRPQLLGRHKGPVNHHAGCPATEKP